MSTAPGHSSLRTRVVELLEARLANTAHRALGRELGVAGTTITARGSDLHAWPADDLLQLSLGDDQLSTAVIDYLRGTDVAGGDSRAVERDLSSIIGRAAQLIAQANQSLSDGQVDVLECATNREALVEVLSLVHKAIKDIDRRVTEASSRSRT